MKKLFLALFCVFFMVSCGSDSSDDVVKNYFEALFKGDVKKALQYVETDGEDMEMIQAYLEESSYKFLNKTNKVVLKIQKLSTLQSTKIEQQ